MKKTVTYGLFATICCAAVLAVSCKDDSKEIGLKPPTSEEFRAFRAKALDDLMQTATFDVGEGLRFESAKGAKITIMPECIHDQRGNVVAGEVTLSFVEIYDRGNMVATNKPVMGKDDAGNKLPLVTGGEYYLNVKKGNQQLKPGCPFYVYLQASHTGGVDPEMVLWEGVIDNNGDLTFELDDRDGGLKADQRGTGYDIWGDKFGWTNVDRFHNDPREKTQIKVHVPAGYHQTNSAVYLAYEDQPFVLAHLDTYDTGGKFFSEHYGFIPVGMKLHIIFVSESNGQVVYAIKPATVVADAAITIHESELNTTTKDNLVSLINALN